MDAETCSFDPRHATQPLLTSRSGGVSESGAPRMPRVGPRSIEASSSSGTARTLNSFAGMSSRALVVLTTGCRAP